MKIQAIELENYGPFFGKHDFVFADRGLVAVLGQNEDEPRMNSNGSGKSSLIDALDWALFGVVPRGDVADTVINDEAAENGDGAKVVVIAEDDDATLRIERSRKHRSDGSTLRLLYNGEDGSALDPKETQKYIEWHLGVDRQVFHATVLFAQADMFKFADATDVERVEILTKILRLELIDEWLQNAKNALARNDEEGAKHVQREAALRGKVDALSKIDDSAQEAQYEQERQGRLQRISAHMAEAQSRSATLQPIAARLQQVREGRERLQKPRPPTSLGQVEKDLADAENNVKSAHTYVVQINERIAHGQRLLKLGNVCPTCEQAIPGQRREQQERHLVDLKMKAVAFKATYDKWTQYVAQIIATRNQIQVEHQKAIEVYFTLVGQADAQVKVSQDAAAELANIQRLMQDAGDEAKRIREAPNPAQQQAAKRIQEIKALLAELDKSGENTRLIQEESRRIRFWIEAFGSKGLKSYILDARLQEMTEAANEWVRMLTGGTYWVRLETQAALKSGALRNRFNIRVFNGHDGRICERNYKSWSGGQKQRVSLGIDFGLSRLIAKRAQKPYDLLILDEIFKHLDSRGRDAVMEMLHALLAEKSTILVVDHDPEFQSMFEKHVTVRMKNWRASILEGKTDDYAARVDDRSGDNEGSTPAASIPRRTPLKKGSATGGKKPSASSKGDAGKGPRAGSAAGCDADAKPKRRPRRKSSDNDLSSGGE